MRKKINPYTKEYIIGLCKDEKQCEYIKSCLKFKEVNQFWKEKFTGLHCYKTNIVDSFKMSKTPLIEKMIEDYFAVEDNTIYKIKNIAKSIRYAVNKQGIRISNNEAWRYTIIILFHDSVLINNKKYFYKKLLKQWLGNRYYLKDTYKEKDVAVLCRDLKYISKIDTLICDNETKAVMCAIKFDDGKKIDRKKIVSYEKPQTFKKYYGFPVLHLYIDNKMLDRDDCNVIKKVVFRSNKKVVIN